MVTVIGVRFRNTGKIYYFDPGEQVIARGMSVIVETSRGIEMGMVMRENHEVDEESVVQPLKSVIRIAETADFDLIRENKVKEKEAFKICQEKIREHGLDMKLVDVEYTFDGNKVLFYFTADGRIDFRELVKDLASVFRTRIELRQIGVRDETKLLGGIGICGRSLCCHSYLSEFIPVSIKMAKEQNLSLNPTKISGVCGRLMCCLKNEEDTYEYLNSQLPRIGEMVTITEEGEEGQVHSVNVLRQKVKILVKTENDDVEMKEYPVEELDFGPDRKPPVHREKIRPMLPEGGEEEITRNSRDEDQTSRSQRRGRESGNRRDSEKNPSGRNRSGSENPQRGDQNRDQSRDHGRDQNRDQNRDRGRDQNRDQSRDRGKEQNRDQNRDRGKEQNRDQSRDHGRDQTRDQSKGHGREQNRDQSRDQNKDQGRDLSRDQNRDQNKDQSRDLNKDQTRDQNKKRSYHRRGHWQSKNKSAGAEKSGNE